MHATIENMRVTLHYYLQNFGFYDYFALMWVLLVFLLLLVVVILIIGKRQGLGSFLLLFDIAFLFIGVYFALKFVDDQTRRREISLNSLKQLTYTDAVIADVNITNLSQKPFKFCKVKIKFFKLSSRKFVQNLYELRPMQTKTGEFNSTIDVNETKSLKIVIDNFRPRDFNTSLSSECF